MYTQLFFKSTNWGMFLSDRFPSKKLIFSLSNVELLKSGHGCIALFSRCRFRILLIDGPVQLAIKKTMGLYVSCAVYFSYL